MSLEYIHIIINPVKKTTRTQRQIIRMGHGTDFFTYFNGMHLYCIKWTININILSYSFHISNFHTLNSQHFLCWLQQMKNTSIVLNLKIVQTNNKQNEKIWSSTNIDLSRPILDVREFNGLWLVSPYFSCSPIEQKMILFVPNMSSEMPEIVLPSLIMIINKAKFLQCYHACKENFKV